MSDVTANTISQEEVKAIIKDVFSIPLHRYLGLELIRQNSEEAVIRINGGPNTLNLAGVVHGGVYYAMLDAACFLAALPLLEQGENMVTHDIHVSVMRPVPQGQDVDFRGVVKRRGRQLVFCEAEATSRGKLIAAASVTKSIVRKH